MKGSADRKGWVFFLLKQRWRGKYLSCCFPIIKPKNLDMTAGLCVVLASPADPCSLPCLYLPKHILMEGDELEVVPAFPLALRGKVGSLV